MKKKCCFRQTLLDLSIMYLFGVSLATCTALGGTDDMEFTALSLKLSVPRLEYHMGEGVLVFIECSNTTTTAIREIPALTPKLFTGYEPLIFYVRRNGEDFVEVHKFLPDTEQPDAHNKESDFKISTSTLAAGHTFREKITLQFDWLQHPPKRLFPSPGIYQIKAYLFDKTHHQKVESNVIEVKFLKK